MDRPDLPPLMSRRLGRCGGPLNPEDRPAVPGLPAPLEISEKFPTILADQSG